MSKFQTPGHLVSWAKISPRTIQSGPRNRSGATGKGNPYLKRVLSEAGCLGTTTARPPSQSERNQQAGGADVVSPVSTRLTVAVDTPAAAATSLIVTGRVTAKTFSGDGKRPSTNRQAWRYPPFQRATPRPRKGQKPMRLPSFPL
jgi:hypothetical protein